MEVSRRPTPERSDHSMSSCEPLVLLSLVLLLHAPAAAQVPPPPASSRSDVARVDDLALGRDLRALFGTPADNVLVVKASYWFNP
jgi:hypothetical protein